MKPSGKERAATIVMFVVPLAHGLFDVMHEVGDGEEPLIEPAPLSGSLGAVFLARIKDGGTSLQLSLGEACKGPEQGDQVEVIAHQVVVGQAAAVDGSVVEEDSKERLSGERILERIPVDRSTDSAHQMIEGVSVGGGKSR